MNFENKCDGGRTIGLNNQWKRRLVASHLVSLGPQIPQLCNRKAGIGDLPHLYAAIICPRQLALELSFQMPLMFNKLNSNNNYFLTRIFIKCG